MKYPRHPGFDGFWSMRGTQAFWITHYFSYPVGAGLAWVGAKIGVSPTLVTVLGAMTAWTGAAYVGLGPLSPAVGGCVLLASLLLAYSLDCADGVLARATQTTSPFGAVLDKVMDAATAMVVPGLLCIGASSRPILWLPAESFAFVGLLIIASRVLLSITVWLKDLNVKQASHLAADERQRTVQWHLRRLIGQTIDTPVFYCLLAGTWWAGGFWEATAAYGLWNLGIWVLYLALSARELSTHTDRGGADPMGQPAKSQS
jgi:phosphatidylglycerophosphate synthase